MRLLLVEDDRMIGSSLRAVLQAEGHAVDWLRDVASARTALTTDRFDLVLLDLGLPASTTQPEGADGLSLLRELRARRDATPVIVITARDGPEAHILGLDSGADDYLTKPFNMEELLARLQSMLRRANLPASGATLAPMPAPAPSEPAGVQRLAMDTDQLRAWLGTTPIDLTPREWALLSLLLRQQGQVVSREAVLVTWQAQPNEPNATGALASNALEVYVHRLRRKLAGSAYGIRNIRGLGYLLDGPAA